MALTTVGAAVLLHEQLSGWMGVSIACVLIGIVCIGGAAPLMNGIRRCLPQPAEADTQPMVRDGSGSGSGT